MNKFKKKEVSLLLAITFVIVLSNFVLGQTVEIVTPSASSTVAGTSVTFNTSMTGYTWGADEFLMNITFYAKSTLTANSSWVSIGTNNSVNLTQEGLDNYTITAIDTLGLEDANNYIFNVSYTNGSGDGVVLADDTNTGMTVDNTVPQAPTIVTPSDNSKDSDGDITFNVTVTGRNTTKCTLMFSGANPGDPFYDMTHSGDQCYVSLTSMPEQTYNWVVNASDETNVTDSAEGTVEVDSKTSSGKATILARSGQVTRTGDKTFALINGLGTIGGFPVVLILVIIGIGIIVYIKKR